MSLATLLLIAIGVSADAFAVAVGKGLQMVRLRQRDAVIIAGTFGIFQGAMPVIGWLLASGFRDSMMRFDHWIAFGLLVAIGARMIWEALHGPDDGEPSDAEFTVRELLVLGIATSIDALAVGVSFAFIDVNIAAAAVAIGLTTFAVSLAGVVIGHRVGSRFRGPAEVAGGLILILLGTHILLEHLGVW